MKLENFIYSQASKLAISSTYHKDNYSKNGLEWTSNAIMIINMTYIQVKH